MNDEYFRVHLNTKKVAGDVHQIRTIPGPYLFGNDETLTPVHITLRDVNNDDHYDLVLEIRNEQVVYLNKDGVFRLPTLEEQQQLVQEQWR